MGALLTEASILMVTTNDNIGMEMRYNYHGFDIGVTSIFKKERYHLGCYELLDKVGTLYPNYMEFQSLLFRIKVHDSSSDSGTIQHFTFRLMVNLSIDEFKLGNKVFLKVSHRKKVLQIDRKGKLNLGYIGPYKITERIEPIVYRLALHLILTEFTIFFMYLYYDSIDQILYILFPPTEIEIQPDIT
ncbi:retrotransposon protein [Gossypium australe]|uniref:Retrotransposon protein n=1 Tax=Gossypium australe TaxID=47621 RepID=A0A5B6X2W7_9ROSI|nr:retrotransposon protein [Gossypium australe]